MKVTVKKLRDIVKEELELVQEELDHKSIKTVVNSAANLLKSIEGFHSSNPTAAMMTGVNTLLVSLKKSLEDMIQNPGSYVDRPGPKVLTVKKPRQKPTL